MNAKNHMRNSNLTLKLLSLFFGFTFWYLFMHQHTESEQIKVPLSFHDIPDGIIIDAPETVDITVYGKWADFHYLDYENLAIHIDASKLKKGPNRVSLSKEYLFLPEQLTLLKSSPSTILIVVHEKIRQE